MDLKMIKKTFKYIFNKPLYMKYYKPLDPPTLKEQELIEDLKNTFKELSYEDIKGYSHPERIWKQNTNSLRELVLKDNPREFLRWDVILETMFVGNENYIGTELDYLRRQPNWNERWEKAIREVETGFPIPFNKYPRSSGNLIHHAYHVAKFEEKTGLSPEKLDFVFEFGGGYGCMCKLFYNLGFKGRYVIYDFPHFSALQKYYLKTVGITLSTRDEFRSSENGVFCVSDTEKLKDILSTYNVDCNSLFIATWSISEAPLHIRNSILPLVSHFKSFLISYQDNFGDVDNNVFFNTYKNDYEHKIKWYQWEIKHIPGNTYLVGIRIPHKIQIRKIHKNQRTTFDEVLHTNFLYRKIQNLWYKRNYRKWTLSGKPIPTPHLIKQMTVKEYAAKYGTEVFVETGTYLGEMVDAVKYYFEKIYSIELSSELYEKAEKKFSRHQHIVLLEGDSSTVLPEILNNINEPCLFWLDAHFSEGITAKGKKETPILEELKHILNHLVKNHVLLIDDARCFVGQNDYPSIKEVREIIKSQYPNSVVNVMDDIIRIHKKT